MGKNDWVDDYYSDQETYRKIRKKNNGQKKHKNRKMKQSEYRKKSNKSFRKTD